MSLSTITDSNKRKEQDIQLEINKSISNSDNIIFNAGAGAGKTYALIESLKYIIKAHGKDLIEHNQKVICITYTNIATSEIKDRLGNTELIIVSTIHERLWDLIKDYKKELLKIHIEKLNYELMILKSDLNDNVDEKIEKVYRPYRDLSLMMKEDFFNYMFASKDIFYDNYAKPSGIFKNAFENNLNKYPKIIKNVSNFKKVVTTLYRIKNYEDCLENIETNKINYGTVKYDARYNSDILHKMLISHDTLLEYSKKIIEKHDLLMRILIDTYPFILIDEYQDTNENVVSIMKYLDDYSKKLNHKLFIGYFGDTAQNIYDDGVGSKIKSVHSGLKPIDKIFNRRSHKEIIDIINNIRDDQIKQESIYSDNSGGSVKFYTGYEDSKNAFIDKYKKVWKINTKNKLHCLVLTNRLVAEFSGFSQIYHSFSNTSFYKQYYDRLNTELLSDDLLKLGVIPSLLYKIVNFKIMLEDPKAHLIDILDRGVYTKLNILELKSIIVLLKSVKGESLYDFVKSFFLVYDNSQNSTYLKVANKIFNLEKFTYEYFENFLLDSLFLNYETEEEDSIREKTKILLNISMDEFKLWYDFINNDQKSDVVFHTYHGTKGAEYKNVLIYMKNDFGVKNRKKFSSYFENVGNKKTLDEKEELKFENTKNLLYVSCSRSIKNLRIYYMDDISTFRIGIEKIFGEINDFKD